CSTCNGVGHKPYDHCTYCHGSTYQYGGYLGIKCYKCKGTGYEPCPGCGGSGYISDPGDNACTFL
ncbi:9183_t:CDS:1, partial [Diversispora eburnea]